MADDLEALETSNDFGTVSSITFSGDSYDAIVSPFENSVATLDAGFMHASGIEVVVRREAFVTLPVVDDEITVDSVTFRITNIVKDGAALTMRCVRQN